MVTDNPWKDNSGPDTKKPTLSAKQPRAKCKRCRGSAVVLLPSHNTAFCGDCFTRFFFNGVRRALKKMKINENANLGVAVSGGKDSLVTWDVLNRMGYPAMGIYLDLGIPGFSGPSRQAVAEFADERGLSYRVYALKDLTGYNLPEMAGKTHYEICALCGTFKRYFINYTAVDNGVDIIATGHNLDDEAARLLGNMLRNHTQYLEKFFPFLPAGHPRQAARMKPLFRMDEHEIRTYAGLFDIRPVNAECPMNRGATTTYYKQCLKWLEEKMPGTKRDFLFNYLKDKSPPDTQGFGTCADCGHPTDAGVCGVCKIKRHLAEKQ